MPTSNLERPVPTDAPPRSARDVSPRRQPRRLLAAAAAGAVAMLRLLAPGDGAAGAAAWQTGDNPGPAARLTRVIDLPGLPYLIDPNGRTVYLTADGSDSFDQVL